MSDSLEASTAEFVEYCHTQAALLTGRVETIAERVDALLDELDDATAAVRTDLESDDPTTDGATLDDIEETQALVREKQATIRQYSSLADGYTELARRLDTDDPDVEEALAEVVRFETIHDAPEQFEDRLTVAEAATDR